MTTGVCSKASAGDERHDNRRRVIKGKPAGDERQWQPNACAQRQRQARKDLATGGCSKAGPQARNDMATGLCAKASAGEERHGNRCVLKGKPAGEERHGNRLVRKGIGRR
jgi:hypothetical protein